MNIVFISPECFPFAKASGLGDLVYSLAKNIEKEGNNVKVFMPRYGFIDPSSYLIEKLPSDIFTDFNSKEINTMVFKGIIPNSLVNVFLTESQNHFSNSKETYLDPIFSEDSCERNAFFCNSVLSVISNFKFNPDIINVFGYQFSSICNLIKKINENKSKIVFTLYNTENISSNNRYIKDTREAIKSSDLILTTSKSYAKTLLNHNTLGTYLQEKKESFKGIFTGIDYDLYNPELDKEITQIFSKNYFSAGKKNCKEELANIFNLDTKIRTPVFGMVTRLNEEKGFNLLINSLSFLSSLNLQLIVLGKGSYNLEQELVKQTSNLKNIRVITDFNPTLAKKIYAGSDFFLSLSKTNSTANSMLTAMNYGSIPIAFSSGINQEIIKCAGIEKNPNGFLYTKYTKEDLCFTVSQALKYFKEMDFWTKLVKEAMNINASINNTTNEYLDFYEDLLLQKIIKE